MLEAMERLTAIGFICLAGGQFLIAVLLIGQNWRIGKLKELAMSLLDDLAGIKGQLDKARGEIVGKIAALEAAVTATPTPEEVVAAVADLKVAAQGLDDIVPDEVIAAVEEAVVEEAVVEEAVVEEAVVEEAVAEAPVEESPEGSPE